MLALIDLLYCRIILKRIAAFQQIARMDDDHSNKHQIITNHLIAHLIEIIVSICTLKMPLFGANEKARK